MARERRDKIRDSTAPFYRAPFGAGEAHDLCPRRPPFTATFSPIMSANIDRLGASPRSSPRPSNSLEISPMYPADSPKGDIPNTPLMASLISFVLGGVFAFGAIIFYSGTFCDYWWATYQLGFFVAAWAAFHWGEFAVTAGWNRYKCSVDCESRPPFTSSGHANVFL